VALDPQVWLVNNNNRLLDNIQLQLANLTQIKVSIKVSINMEANNYNKINSEDRDIAKI